MSQWHGREGIPDGNTYRVIFHIPIPSANNRVGVNYRTALIGSGIGGTTVMTEGNGTGQIPTAEKNSIATGALLEVNETIDTNPGETANALTTRLNARFTELANVNGPFLSELKRRLEYWGGAAAS
jgi:hypothetical protein